MQPILQDLHKVPFLRVLLPFIMGIIFISYLPFPTYIWIIFLFLGLSGSIYFQMKQPGFGRRDWPGYAFFLLWVSIGGLIAHGYYNEVADAEAYQSGEYVGYITSLPVEKKSTHLVEVKFVNDEGEHPGKVWCYVDKSIPASLMLPGKWVHVKTKLQKPEHAALKGEFDFAAYLQSIGVHYTCYVGSDQITFPDVEPVRNLSIRRLLIQNKVLEILQNNQIEGDNLALLSAVTIGYKKLIDKDQRESFSASGVTHILAVSGLHVGILYLMIGFVFRFLKRLPHGKIYFLLVILSFLWLYAFITGFSASVSRSALMFSLIAVGKNLRKQHYMMNTIAASAFLLLLFQPRLLFQPGFQLSYAAVCGIVLFHKPLSEKWPVHNKFGKWIRDLCSVSVIAQMSTAPLVVYYFHTFSLVGVFANLLVIPLITILLYAVIFMLVLGFVGIYYAPLAFVVNAVASILNSVVEGFGNLSFSSIPFLHLDNFQLSLFLIVLVMMVFAIYYPGKKQVFAILSLWVILGFYGFVQKMTNFNRIEFVRYVSNGKSIVCIHEGNKGYLISDEMPTYIPNWFYKPAINEVIYLEASQDYTSQQFSLINRFVVFPDTTFQLNNSLRTNPKTEDPFYSYNFVFNNQ